MLREQDKVIRFYSHAVIIYNPRAGQLKHDRLDRLHRATETVRSYAREVHLVSTEGPRTAGALASAAIGNGADLIIAAGGDGTISEVVDGMAHSNIPLGILPAGTANVLAHEIRMGRNMAEASNRIPNCSPERVSLGRIELPDGRVRHFLMMVGAGFDAQIIYHLSAGWKDKLGKLSYFLGGLLSMGTQLRQFEAVTGDGAHPCTFALVTKVKNYGGDFEIAAEVHLRDNRFEVVLFESRNSWRYLRYLAGVATRDLAHTPGVRFARTDCIHLRPLRDGGVYLQADGELIGKLPATIRIVPDALTLLLPDALLPNQAVRRDSRSLVPG